VSSSLQHTLPFSKRARAFRDPRGRSEKLVSDTDRRFASSNLYLSLSHNSQACLDLKVGPSIRFGSSFNWNWFPNIFSYDNDASFTSNCLLCHPLQERKARLVSFYRRERHTQTLYIILVFFELFFMQIRSPWNRHLFGYAKFNKLCMSSRYESSADWIHIRYLTFLFAFLDYLSKLLKLSTACLLSFQDPKGKRAMLYSWTIRWTL